MPGPRVNQYTDETNTAERWAASDQWVGVDSSNVAKIRYDAAARVLWVQFLDGSTYYYNGVTETIAISMYNSGSHGKFVWWLRRNGYPGEKAAPF